MDARNNKDVAKKMEEREYVQMPFVSPLYKVHMPFVESVKCIVYRRLHDVLWIVYPLLVIHANLYNNNMPSPANLDTQLLNVCCLKQIIFEIYFIILTL